MRKRLPERESFERPILDLQPRHPVERAAIIGDELAQFTNCVFPDARQRDPGPIGRLAKS